MLRVLCSLVLSGLALSCPVIIFPARGFGGRKDVYNIMQECPLPAKLALSAKLIDGNLSDSVYACVILVAAWGYSRCT